MEQDGFIKKAAGQIESALERDGTLCIEDLAAFSNFSKFHFQRLFRACMGVSVMEYVKKRRLSLAGRALSETGCPVVQAAFQYGYGSHESFTRAFKAYHGVTPAECKKYHIYRTFDGVLTGKEPFIMNGNYQLKERLDSYTGEVLAGQNALLARMRETSEKIRKTAEKSSLPNFLAIASEINQLADRVEQECREIQNMPALCGPAGDEGFSAFQRKSAVLKTIQGLAVQTELIAFFTEIQIARTEPETRKAVEPAGQWCGQLSSQSGEGAGKALELFRELDALIREDIQSQAYQALENAAIQAAGAAGRVREKAAACPLKMESLPLARQKAEEIAKDAESGAESLRQACTGAGKSREAAELAAESLAAVLEDHTLQLNVLAFHVELDCARLPESREREEAVQTYMSLPPFLAEAGERMAESLEHFQEWMELAERMPIPESNGIALEHTLFLGTIVADALSWELAKLQQVIPVDGLERLKACEASLKTALASASKNPSAFVSPKEKAAYVKQEWKSAAEQLSIEAGKLGDKGPVLVYLAERVRRLAEGIC